MPTSRAPAHALDKPPLPGAIDLEIQRRNGQTVALEATAERLKASKGAPAPSMSQRIQELTRENGQLRLEIRYHHRMQAAMQALHDDAHFVLEQLENATVGFDKAQKEAIEDWYAGREAGK